MLFFEMACFVFNLLTGISVHMIAGQTNSLLAVCPFCLKKKIDRFQSLFFIPVMIISVIM